MVRKVGGSVRPACSATGGSHRPLVRPDLECSRHSEGAQEEQKTPKRVTKPGGRLQERGGCVRSRPRMGRMPWPRAGFGRTGSRERHWKGPGGLVWGRGGVHAGNHVLRLDGLRCNNLCMRLNGSPAGLQTGLGGLRQPHPLGAGPRAKSTFRTWLFGAVMRKSRLI